MEGKKISSRYKRTVKGGSLQETKKKKQGKRLNNIDA
jgi:hypothetical protein